MKRRALDYFIALTALLVLLVLSWFLISKNKRKDSKKEPLENTQFLTATYDAPPIKALAISGKPEIIDFSQTDKKKLLFIWHPSCSLCEENITFWNRFSHQLKDKVQIIGILTCGLEEAQLFERTKGINFPLYIPTDRQGFITNYKVLNFSQTILIDERGKIQNMKAGRLDRDDYVEIKQIALNHPKY